MKVGILVSFISIPQQTVQELVCQSIGDQLNFEEVVVAKIRFVVSYKVAMMDSPAPMDIGRDGHECEHEDFEDGSPSSGLPVSRERRQRSKALEKGFGDKGKGKGAKGDTQKGAKGRRKGARRFKGAHASGAVSPGTASERKTDRASAIEEELEEDEVRFGGSWMVGAVGEHEEDHPWTESRRLRTGGPCSGRNNLDSGSRFCVLAVETETARKHTRTSAIEFNVAEVRKPLASTARMVRCGNRVVRRVVHREQGNGRVDAGSGKG